jgi:hypothetical protein
MIRHPRASASLFLLFAALQAPSMGQQTLPVTAKFNSLDTARKELHNFNIETVRGMAWSPNRQSLFAINTHGSRLVRYDGPSPAIVGNWTTLHNPVAMGVWAAGEEILGVIVLGGGTHAVASHNPSTGEILEVLNLPSEPGDMVIAPDGHAFISCMGANTVVEVDLATFSVVREYPIPSQRPRFLFLDPESGENYDYRVYVAPFISGNNTIANGSKTPRQAKALVPDDPATPTLEGLPDEDLFELIPPVGGGGAGTAVPLLKGVGHLILEHARAPDGNYWLLSISPENADPLRQTEPALRGDFAVSGLTLTTIPARGATAIVAPAPIDLDDFIPGNGVDDYATAESCSFPVAVSIDPLTGWAMIASSTNDRMILVNSSGTRTNWKFDFPAGSIPRDILTDRVNNTIVVYCWGSNDLYIFDLNNLNAPPLVASLGLDPTPTAIAEGRELWYDAENSLNGRSTCNTCHPGGGSDFLGWPLSGDPEDRKDVMVTQSLLSIEDTFPYHWRGERELRDFNRLAFPGLLGGTSLSTAPGGDFDKFKEFVFSLQAPRNPLESWDRVVDDTLAPIGVSAVMGQDQFNTVDSLFGGFTCAECHTQPEGTNGGVSFDNATTLPQAGQLDVAHLRQLFNKSSDLLTVDIGGNPVSLPRLGWGLSHDGNEADVVDFLQIPFPFTLSSTERDNIAAFVDQFDQGIAPAAQLSWQLDSTNPGPAEQGIQKYLIRQAAKHWLDVVAFGTLLDQSGTPVQARWLYDPTAQVFLANDSAIQLAGRPVGTALFADFATQAQAGTGSNTFLGLPLGNGQRFARDPDNDRLIDGDELALMPPSDPEVADTDGDGDPDGHEVANGGNPTDPTIQSSDTTNPSLVAGFPIFVDAGVRTAEYELRFSEPVTYTITYSRPGDPALTRSRHHAVMSDTIVLQELYPSSMEVRDGAGVLLVPRTPSTYTLSISMTDEGGLNTNSAILHQPTADDQIEGALETSASGSVPSQLPLNLVVSALSMTVAKSGNSMTGTVNATVAALHEGLNAGGLAGFFPQSGQVVLAQVLKDTGTGWQVVPASQVTSPGASSGYLLVDSAGNTAPGPLLDVVSMPVTASAGTTTQNFTLSGLNSGDKVRFNIVGIFTVGGPSQGGLPVFDSISTFAWQLPMTQDDPGGDASKGLRGIQETF